MDQTAESLNHRELVTNGLIEVFSTMLSMDAKPTDDTVPPDLGERVTGSIGIVGEKVVGTTYIHFEDQLAKEAAAGMMGMEIEELEGDSDVNDVVGELCNMVAGGLKSTLSDHGASCALSPPSIIRGAAFRIEGLDGFRQEVVCFECQSRKLVLELHIKFS